MSTAPKPKPGEWLKSIEPDGKGKFIHTFEHIKTKGIRRVTA